MGVSDLSGGVVEDDPDGVARTAAHQADAVAQRNAIGPPRSGHGAVMDGEHHRVALGQGHILWTDPRRPPEPCNLAAACGR